MSDVSIYFVWLLALLVVRDELEHLWRAISCCRLNRSPQVSHLNGSFARSATVLLLLTVPQCGIWLLCRFKSCGRLNFCPLRSQDICKASLSTAVILRLFVSCSIVVVTIRHTHTFPSGVVHKVNIPSSCASALARRQVLNWMPSSHNGTNSEHTYTHTSIHTYIIIMRQDHQLPAQLGLYVVVSSSINTWQCHKYPTLQQRVQAKSMMTDHLKTYIHTYIHHGLE